jgi:hypothetical protein
MRWGVVQAMGPPTLAAAASEMWVNLAGMIGLSRALIPARRILMRAEIRIR